MNEPEAMQSLDEKQIPQIEWKPIIVPDDLWDELWRIKLEFGFVLHGVDELPSIKFLACCAHCGGVFNRSEDGESYSCSCGSEVGSKAMEIAEKKVQDLLVENIRKRIHWMTLPNNDI